MSKTIKITEVLKKKNFIEDTDGEVIYNLLKGNIDNNQNVILDCSGIEMSIFKPFHICIGRFFDTIENGRKFLTHVSIKGDDYIKEKVNTVITNAQKFYDTLDQE